MPTSPQGLPQAPSPHSALCLSIYTQSFVLRMPCDLGLSARRTQCQRGQRTCPKTLSHWWQRQNSGLSLLVPTPLNVTLKSQHRQPGVLDKTGEDLQTPPPILPRTLQPPQPLCRGPLGWGVGLVTESVPRPSRGTAFVSRIKNQYLAQLGLPLRIHSTVKWIHDPGHTHERLLCVRHPSEPIL